ncbi:uncharacterized protein LOC133064284 isoform X1 [Dama dama]|uniref:uncharacterized protein LOC133064284 isoform X1 n=1 Tax=Dama dama TaxID=30532 RepID=UPI002A36A44D|nr:uncharacterized protein LOC133064284 isoform X1 [Dama dama]
MTSGNPSRDSSGGAVSSTSLLALLSASPWRRSPWGHRSGLRAAGSVLGRGCACPASHPPRPLRARAPCHARVAGRGPPCHPAPSRPGQSPEPGWGRPALEGEEGRLQKTGLAGGQLSSLGCSRWLLHAWVAAGSPREEHLIPLRLQPRLVALSTQPLDLGARPSPLPEPTLPLSDLRAARNQRNSSLIKHHLPQAVDGSVISRV